MAISDIEVTRRHTLKAISAVMAMLTPLGAMAVEKRQVIKKCHSPVIWCWNLCSLSPVVHTRRTRPRGR